MPGKHVRFNEENILYSPAPSDSTPSQSNRCHPQPHPPDNRRALLIAVCHIAPRLPIYTYYPPYIFPVNYDVSYPPNTASANIHPSSISLDSDSCCLAEHATNPPIHDIPIHTSPLQWHCQIDASTLPYVEHILTHLLLPRPGLLLDAACEELPHLHVPDSLTTHTKPTERTTVVRKDCSSLRSLRSNLRRTYRLNRKHRRPAHLEACQMSSYITRKITRHGVCSPYVHHLADARSV